MPHVSLEAAQAHCQSLARDHYENFPTASLLLPARVRPAVAAIYAFARQADDYADEAEHEGHRLERLDAHERALDDAIAGRPDGPAFTALADAVQRFDLPVQSLRDLLDAFRQDCRVPRYQTFEEVLDYCRRSASPVGRLVLALHDLRDARRIAASDATCTGLQLANFWQDIAVDLEKDRIYLPREDRERFGVSEEDLFAGRVTDGFRQLVRFQVERTREVFAPGHALVAETRGRLGLWLRMVWAGGHRVLTRIERQDGDTLSRRPALGLADWLAIGLPALLGRAAPRPRARAPRGTPS